MSDEQDQVYKEEKDQDISNTGSDEGIVCEKCGKNPCVCPKDIDDLTVKEEGDEEDKKPPKVRWI